MSDINLKKTFRFFQKKNPMLAIAKTIDFFHREKSHFDSELRIGIQVSFTFTQTKASASASCGIKLRLTALV